MLGTGEKTHSALALFMTAPDFRGHSIFVLRHSDGIPFCLDAEGLGIIPPVGPFVHYLPCAYIAGLKPSMASIPLPVDLNWLSII